MCGIKVSRKEWQQKNGKTEKATALGRRTGEQNGKGNKMTGK